MGAINMSLNFELYNHIACFIDVTLFFNYVLYSDREGMMMMTTKQMIQTMIERIMRA